MSRTSAAAGCLLAALALVGAAGAASPTRGQLRLMPLPKSSFGAAATALSASGPSWLENADAARSDLMPLTGAKLAALGRVTGFGLDFVDASTRQQPARLVIAGSAVSLFRDAAGASRYLTLEASAVRRYRGRRIHQKNGATLSAFSPFALPGVRGAVGIRAKAEAGQTQVWLTVVLFREGVLVGNVALARTDLRDLRTDARGVTAAFVRRIRAVLAGRIHG